MTDTTQLPPLPTLRPGDSHMESLIEAAIQGHASTREAMRWLVRQIVPQPAQATQADVTDATIDAIADSISYPMLDRASIRQFARAILALRPAAVPMTDEVFDLICNAIDKADTISMEGDYMLDSDDCIAVVRVMQVLLSAHHGITAQAKKETP